MRRKKFLLLLASPSGGGKSTLLTRLLEKRKDIIYSVSTTTRAPRGNEVNGKEYFFITEEEFVRKIEKGYFLEYANVHGKWYGTSKEFIQQQMNLGNHVILDIDVQGVQQIKEQEFDVVSIFILPPTQSTLQKRLIDRKTESTEQIEIRMQTAKKEIVRIAEYDYLVINDDIETAIDSLDAIIRAEEIKTQRYVSVLEDFYQ